MEHLLFECSIRAALMGAGTAMVLSMARVKTAAARHAAWTGVLALMLLLPAWIAWGPKAAVRVLPAPAAAVTEPWIATVTPDPQPIRVEQAARERVIPWRALALGAYVAGALWLLLRLAVGSIRANRLTGADCVAPITVGLFRPRVILPDGWQEWPPSRLAAILAHEHAHVRRHDPLVQWLALLNRALFWLHPLAWWIERKLAALAEEACDAAVLESGHDAGEYAQCLIEMERTVIQAGTRFPALGMAMPGSGLPQRVKKIFEGTMPARMSRSGMICAAAALSATAIVFGAGTIEHAPELLRLRTLPAVRLPRPPEWIPQTKTPAAAPAAKPRFDVASIRPATPLPLDVPGGPGLPPGRLGITAGPGTTDPERFTARLVSLRTVLLRAYGLRPFQLSGTGSLDSQWDIEAKVPPGATVEQLNLMLQNLLEERFHLKIHRETRDFAAYNLVVAKGGLKLKDSVETTFQSKQTGIAKSAVQDSRECPPPPAPGPLLNRSAGPCGRPASDGSIVYGRAVTMASVANILTMAVNPAPVIDKTGLTDLYDIRDEFAPSYAGAPEDSPLPSVFTALEKDLGLKLEPTKAPFDILVVDHIDSAPTDN